MRSISHCLLLLSVLLFNQLLSADEVTDLPLALNGLDPVSLLEGSETAGMTNLMAGDGHYRYQFSNEANLQLFNANQENYRIQNEFCPVFPQASVNPALYAVHDGKIYAFAMSSCVSTFQAQPDSFL